MKVTPEPTRPRVAEHAPKVAFPVRAAALDVGSNAIRFSIAEFSDVHHYVELDAQRFAVRLGHDAFTTGMFTRATLDAGVAAAVAFRKRLDDLGVSRYRAVGTSALRESRNGGELVDRIRQESGVHLETITGSEEARLVWLGVQERIQLKNGTWILADLGGGSIEISLIDDEGIQASATYPLGTVRLLEDLPDQDESPARFRSLLKAYARRLSLPGRVQGEVTGIILTGGNAEALADLVHPDSEAGSVVETTRAELRQALERLSGMSVRDRVEKLGLREDRADVIVPAGVIFDRVAELGEGHRILVPRVGVKDGLLLDLALDYAEHKRHESELDRVTRSGAIAVGRRHRFDEAHARHVSRLALSLFDQLQHVHELGEASRRRLETAALLHDVGQNISYRRHHKHSWYLVMHSELPGLAAEDVRIAALVTRYHRRSEPKEYHEGYSELKEPERMEVKQLAAILRVADALDHEHRGRVKSVEIEVTGRKAQLRLIPGEDTLLEQWALKKKSSLFERVYEVELEVL